MANNHIAVLAQQSAHLASVVIVVYRKISDTALAVFGMLLIAADSANEILRHQNIIVISGRNAIFPLQFRVSAFGSCFRFSLICFGRFSSFWNAHIKFRMTFLAAAFRPMWSFGMPTFIRQTTFAIYFFVKSFVVSFFEIATSAHASCAMFFVWMAAGVCNFCFHSHIVA